MDWTPAKVSVTLNDPRAEHEQKNALAPIADVALTVSQQLENASTEAFEKTQQIMQEATKDDVALKAALAILDRAGYTPIRRELKLEGEIPADPEVLREMQKTLAESASIKATYKISAPPPQEGVQTTHSEIEDADYEIVDEDGEGTPNPSPTAVPGVMNARG